VEVTVNGAIDAVPDGATVGQLVDRLGVGRKGVAVACNDDVVPRSSWDDTVLQPGDRIEMLTVAQGG
jgi:sulfur carrier protein